MDLWVAPTDGGGEPRPYRAETHQEVGGRISPDGRWTVYESWEDGANIYVDSKSVWYPITDELPQYAEAPPG